VQKYDIVNMTQAVGSEHQTLSLRDSSQHFFNDHWRNIVEEKALSLCNSHSKILMAKHGWMGYQLEEIQVFEPVASPYKM
jgi:glutaredoxin-related protein